MRDSYYERMASEFEAMERMFRRQILLAEVGILNRLAAVPNVWANGVPLSEFEAKVATNERLGVTKMYVIGFDTNGKLYGPFKTAEAAAKWASKNLDSVWIIRVVKKPFSGLFASSKHRSKNG